MFRHNYEKYHHKSMQILYEMYELKGMLVV
jgi:hypothetical protein